MLVRKAVPADVPAVTAIYGALLDREERGELSTGWIRGVYPTEQTALDALAAGTLYVLEDGGRVAAAAKLDQNQMAQYSQCTWRHDAPPEQVLVLHTLPLLGGSVGALLGMRVFHHKTKHWYFVWGVPAILLAQLALAVWLLTR